MSDKLGVTEKDSLTLKSEESLPGKGNNGSSKASDAELAELREALKKKDIAIEDLRGKVETYQEQLETRLQELQEKTRLSAGEVNEVEALEKQIHELDNHQYGKALAEKMKRVSADTMSAAEKKFDFQLAKEWVEDKAEELNIDSKKFEETLVAKFTGGRWGDKSLRQRVKLAFKEIQSEETVKKEREELEKKKIEFAERGGRVPRTGGNSSSIELVKEGKLNDALDNIYNSQIEEQRKLKRR